MLRVYPKFLHTIFPFAFPFAGLLLLIVCTIEASRVLLAQIYQHHASLYLQQWAKRYRHQPSHNTFSIPLVAYSTALQSVNRALIYQPDNPTLHEQSAHTHRWHTFVDEHTSEGYQPYHYQQAIQQRPAWPATWAHLMTAQTIMGIRAETYELALSRSRQLGPWTTAVQQQIDAATKAK